MARKRKNYDVQGDDMPTSYKGHDIRGDDMPTDYRDKSHNIQGDDMPSNWEKGAPLGEPSEPPLKTIGREIEKDLMDPNLPFEHAGDIPSRPSVTTHKSKGYRRISDK